MCKVRQSRDSTLNGDVGLPRDYKHLIYAENRGAHRHTSKSCRGRPGSEWRARAGSDCSAHRMAERVACLFASSAVVGVGGEECRPRTRMPPCFTFGVDLEDLLPIAGDLEADLQPVWVPDGVGGVGAAATDSTGALGGAGLLDSEALDMVGAAGWGIAAAGRELSAGVPVGAAGTGAA